MTIATPIVSLKMSDESSVSVPHGGIVVFVGPNNSGKSVSLRDIHGHLNQQNTAPLAVKSLDVSKSGTQEDLVDWLDRHCHKTFQNGLDHYSRSGTSPIQVNALTHYWNNGPPYNQLGQMLTFFAGGEGRLQAANAASNINFLTEPPSHPFHSLYLDSGLEKKISDVAERAFDMPLVLNRHAGTMLYLHVGKAPPAPHGLAAPPREYLEALNALPRLDQQGDGMKSFLGLMTYILTGAYPLVFVDEPEAFLHPPQAQLLGRMLGDEKAPDAQIFLATHDSNVLRGLLDSSAKDVTIVRLVRDGEVNSTSQLNPEEVKELWKDPLLRYSNIMDGMFHEAVVVCEGDADCRFYASVLSIVEADENEAKRPDLLFTHCGGKARMPTVVEALRAVSVPVRVIADFDVLRDKQPLKKIVENLGGDWSSIEDDWSVVKSALDAETRAPSTAYVREEVLKLLDGIETPTLSKKDVEKIRQLTKGDSGWERTKRSGKSAVPPGQATARLGTLLALLRTIGLFVVEVGQLEGFVPEIGNHGPAWVNEVHERGLHADESLTQARAFVSAVAESTAK